MSALGSLFAERKKKRTLRYTQQAHSRYECTHSWMQRYRYNYMPHWEQRKMIATNVFVSLSELRAAVHVCGCHSNNS